jgi:hypothetical protein
MSGQDPQPGTCFFCARPVPQHDPSLQYQVCSSCDGRPRAVVLGMARRPADAELLARAVLTLRDYVLSDDGPATSEPVQRPRYITSSSPPPKEAK